MRAVIYTRVSQDRAGGRSPEEQEAEARRVCDREGWIVVEVVTDSLGASRHSKGTRSGWREVRDLLADGRADVLVTWEASRATRDLQAYADLRDLCVRHEVLWNYRGRTHDLSTSEGRFATGIDALLAEREADETSERVKRAMRANAAAGRPHGRRLFGYRRVYDPSTGRLVGQEPDPTEAPTVRRIFRDYLSGKGIRTIAADLNREGVTTGSGAKWNDVQVRRVLTNRSYIAERVHRGEIVRDADWPALVERDLFDRAAARLAAKRGTRQTSTARLLTGVGRCYCGAKLFAGHDRKQRKVYLCRAGFHVARDMRKLDGYVTGLLLERLSSETLTYDAAPPVQRAELAELRSRLEDATDQFAAGRLTGATLAKIETKLLARISQLEVEVRRGLVPLDVEVPPSGLDDWWDGLTAGERREVVGAWISTVTVHPTGRGSRTFDPSAVHVEWRR